MIGKILSAFGYEKRTVYDESFHPDVWGRAITPSGFVSETAVLSNLSVAYRAIDLKAQLLASVPFHAYHRMSDGGRERAVNIPLARVLERPNGYMSKFEFVELVSRCLDTRGNFYARVEHAATGEIRALHPIDPMRVQVERTQSGRLRYRISASSSEPARVLLDSEVLHVKNPSPDGLVGLSPIQAARGVLAQGITLAATSQAVSETSFAPHGYLKHPGKLSPQAKANIAKAFVGEQPTPTIGGVRVLEEGISFERVGFSAEEIALLENKKLSGEDTARVFGVNPQSVGILGTTSYGSQQQAATDLVVNTLAPLAARIEAAFERCLMSPEAARMLFVEFSLDGLLRADPNERWRTHEIARRCGAISPNEIRRMENMPPYVGGDTYEPLRSAPSEASAPPIASTRP